MRNLKLELFNYKKTLNLDQEDIMKIIEAHLNVYDQTSEKQVVRSLNEKLDIYKYDDTVNTLLENVNAEINENDLTYALRDLYMQVEKADQGGMIYRHPMKVILDILNEGSDQEKTARILNELALYDFVPPIKKFLLRFTENPIDRANMTSDGGKAEKVFTIVEKVDSGHLAFVNDKWFFIGESSIEPATLDKWFTNTDKLRQMNRLQQAVQLSEIEDDELNFKIDEHLILGISTKDGSISLNGEKANKETTLENVFNSPIIPFMKKDYYPIISETVNNIDKFVDLDIALKVYNVTNPFLESFVFNYNEKMYTYSVDRRYGNSFFEYSSAVELVNEMQNDLGYDLTYFFKNKFDDEVITKKNLEDREKIVVEKLGEVNYNIDRLNVADFMKNDQMAAAKEMLVNEKQKLENELTSIKRLISGKDKERVLNS
jgi:hypothetical protein